MTKKFEMGKADYVHKISDDQRTYWLVIACRDAAWEVKRGQQVKNDKRTCFPDSQQRAIGT